MEEIYKKITSVDIGSTNSQIAQRYEVSSDGGTTWTTVSKDSYLLSTSGSTDYPTVLIYQEDLSPEQQTMINMDKKTISGHEANRIHANYYQIPLRSEFKKHLYYSDAEKKADEKKQQQYKKAQESTQLFLNELKNREADDSGFLATEEITYVSVPVRATSEQREDMKKYAIEAGFKNVVVLDETEGILNYALNSKEGVSIFNQLGQLTMLEKMCLLIIDIGGSTTDMLMIDIGPDGNGGYVMKQLGKWPETGETDTLGGIDIDKKLCQWFLENKYLHDGLTEEYINRNGYKDFRLLKEQIATEFRNKGADSVVEQLRGDLCLLAGNRKDGFSKNDYDDDSSKKIDGTVYIDEIFSEYASKQQQAMRKLLADCALSVEDVDGIILAGGGSLMYGIEELFRGELKVGDNPLSFPQIIADPSKLIVIKNNASGLCALGNVLPKVKIPYRKHCLGQYKLKLEIYTAKVGTVSEWDKSFHGNPDIPVEFVKRYTKTWQLAELGEPLPLEIHCEDSSASVRIPPKDSVVFVAKITSVKDNKSTFQYGFSTYALRGLGRAWNDLWNKEHQDQFSHAAIKVKINIGEDLLISITPDIKVDGFWGLLSSTQTAQGTNG